jgi:hypothetical protein
MVKGGRVIPLKGFIASALHVKPIVSLDAAGKGIAFEKSFSQKGLLKKCRVSLKIFKVKEES